MGYDITDAKEFVELFHCIQCKLSNTEIYSIMGKDCAASIQLAVDVNSYVRRHLLYTNGLAYHTKALTEFTRTYLQNNIPAHWPHTYAAFAYMYLCACVDCVYVDTNASVSKDVMEFLDHVKENVFYESDFGVQKTVAGDITRITHDECQFLIKLNNRTATDKELNNLLGLIHNREYAYSLHGKYVSESTLGRIRLLLMNLPSYTDAALAAIYALALHIIEHPDEDPHVLHKRYISDLPFPAYLEEHTWNPGNGIIYTR